MSQEQNESLGIKILNKLNAYLGEDVEQVDPTEAETEGDAANAPAETSETLKKLQGHLLRFQEAENDKKVAAAGAVGGAIAGRQLARRAAKKAYGLDGIAKNYARKGAAAAADTAKLTNKAIAQHTIGKAAKAAGEAGKAKAFGKAASATAAGAEAAAKTAKGAGKAIKALAKPINKAGRAGGWKGAAIGGAAAYLGKKAYDKFKKN